MKTIKLYDGKFARISVEEFEEYGYRTVAYDKTSSENQIEKFQTLISAMDRAFDLVVAYSRYMEERLQAYSELEEEEKNYVECPWCEGKGHFTEYGKPTTDESCRECIQCLGAKLVVREEAVESFGAE